MNLIRRYAIKINKIPFDGFTQSFRFCLIMKIYFILFLLIWNILLKNEKIN